MSDELLRAGRLLMGLPKPMNRDEIVHFAERIAFDTLVSLDRAPGEEVEALSGLMLDDLKPRGATSEQIEEVARLTIAVLRAKPSLTIEQAKHLLRGMWLGAMLLRSKPPAG
jgi:hypothetical protein